MHNAQRTESLETKMLAAERKHAMADVARGVSHDLNNALGAVLPLVEQMRADADSGTLDAKTFADDLKQIDQTRHNKAVGRSGGSNYGFGDGSARFMRFGQTFAPVNMWAVDPAIRNVGLSVQ